ncbi:MAG: GAF domain-containing protein [Ardenticatenaceae bacterium]|nr:GAF domain-containing protein [Ardenticatenaceae bacterium]MCB9443625.1 GAF domain-containing protein [Ardenticatenaceae bacterium]
MSFSIFSILLFAGSIISCILIYLAWRDRNLANPIPFSLFMFATIVWSIAYAFIIDSLSIESKVFWLKMGYWGTSAAPVIWLIFILQYTHRQKYLTRRVLILLSIIPTITILLCWTNEFHLLVWKSIYVDGNNRILTFEFGIWNWVFVIYSYLLILSGTFLLIRTLAKLLTPAPGQIVTLLFGALLPLTGNLMFVTGVNPVKPLDPTPFTFILAGSAMYWGFHRFRLLQVLPLIQSTLFDNLPDGVLVLNTEDVIVTLNPAAKKLLAGDGAARPLSELFPDAAKPLDIFRDAANAQTIFSTGSGQQKRYFDWRLSTMHNYDGQVNGRVITLRDITKEQQAKENLQALHKKTEAQTETLRQREIYLQILNDITQASVRVANLPDLLQIVADKMGELVKADACHITLWEDTDQHTSPGAASGFFKDTYHSIRIEPGETTFTQSVLQLGRALPIEDTFNTPFISQRLANLFPTVKSALALPFIAANEKLGAALLLFNRPHSFSTNEIDQAEQAATQIALAIAKFKFDIAMKRQIEELAVLNDIATVGAESNNVNELISRVTEIARTKFYPDNFGVYLLDEQTGMLQSHPSYYRQIQLEAQPVIPLNQGIVGKVAATGKALRVGDVSQCPNYRQIIPQTRSELCVPLRADDRIIGVINAESYDYDMFTLQDEQLLATIAGQLATAIKKIHLLTSEQSRRQEAETLREATAVLTSTLDLNHLLNLILQQLEKVIAYDSATIFMFQGPYARIVACRGLPDNDSAIGQLFPAQNELLTKILNEKSPIYLENARKEPAFRGWEKTNYTQGWLGIPLIVRDTVIGHLTIDSRQKGRYGPNEAELALAFANQAAVAIENARLYTGEQEQRKVAEILRSANVALTQNLSLDAILAILLDFLGQLVPYDSAIVFQLKQDGQLEIKAHRGYENRTDFARIKEYPFNTASVWTFNTILQSRQGLLISETQEQTNWQSICDPAYVKSWLGMPLIVGNRVFGFFSVDKMQADFFTEEHLRLTGLLAGQTAVALQNAILYQDTQRWAEEMESINHVTTALRHLKTVDDVLAAVLKISINAVNGIRGQGVIINQDSGDYEYRGCFPYDENYIGQHYQIDKGIMVNIINSGEVYTTEDIFVDPMSNFLPAEAIFLQEVKGSIFLPLHTQTRIIGVLHVGVAERRPFTQDEIKLLTTIAEIAGSALDRALLLETLEQRIADRTHDLSLANEQLQELDRLKTKFISDVSHELRTPITNINLYLDLLEQGQPDKQPYYMEVIRKQSGRLTGLIEDTLSLSRLDLGHAKIEMVPVQLNQIIQPIVAAHQPHAELSSLKLTTELQADLPLVAGEPNQLSQVITNLVTNAINYTPSGNIHVSTSGVADRSSICLEVKDTGIGIDEEDQKHLFERFYRGKNTGQSNIPGTGLGLAIVQEIVKLHEGQIEIESEPGNGTTVRIYFPYYDN